MQYIYFAVHCRHQSFQYQWYGKIEDTERANQKPLTEEGSKDNGMAKRKTTKRQTMICKTLHRHLNI